ncbi:winged helix-turn-helix transcriptional regulator [Novosphingobium malaysiense]|uniref:HTH hxlR-type domain-containing protein n=1 Tax=Novosphingobium malaysiense TaxID=1348853 RepID=A0A0B1ZGV0_9SPHN|nr:helix-turn-helix domain-containing protein [Novosphingobium malaysiense]KHK90326.1 hypothetical protein LK12_17080 [Novosphingobium malaysiense]
MTNEADPPHLIRNCSVERTLAIVGDAWAFLILREFYMGARRFAQIHAALEPPRSTLSNRLAQLTDAGVIEKRGSEYRLTESGKDLYLVMLALMRFGDKHLLDEHGPPLTLIHNGCGHPFTPDTACSECGGAVHSGNVTYRDGPGAGFAPRQDRQQRRRRKGAQNFERNRPSSVSRTVEVVAERWTFLILREFFFGVRRYEQLRENLGIAPNILSDRLSHLVRRGILIKQVYSESPVRKEYHLTPAGRDLYLPLIQMLSWGDHWLGYPAPLILTHTTCGRDFQPLIVCSHCREPVDAGSVRYRLNYAFPEAVARSPALLGKVEGDA